MLSVTGVLLNVLRRRMVQNMVLLVKVTVHFKERVFFGLGSRVFINVNQIQLLENGVHTCLTLTRLPAPSACCLEGSPSPTASDLSVSASCI